jgi:hypothetical protein
MIAAKMGSISALGECIKALLRLDPKPVFFGAGGARKDRLELWLDLRDGHCSNRQRNSQGHADLTCTTDKTDVKFRESVMT